MASSKEARAVFVRNFIFGVEDSLVSTIGLISGIAVVGVPRKTIVVTGVILILVEGFSMAVGSFLSEDSVEEYLTHKGSPLWRSLLASTVMFFSYFFAGFIPLLPYIVLEPGNAFGLSIVSSLVTLFLLGAVSAKFFRVRILRQGFKMLFVGGGAIVLGVFVGRFINGLQ